jgi:hypothetical protein
MVVALIPHLYVSRRMEMVVALIPHPFVSRHICNGSCSNSTYITGCDVRAMVVCCHSSPSYSFTFPHQMLHTRSHWLVAQMFIGLKAMIYIYIYIYISKFSSPKEREKGYLFFPNLSQLSTRGRNSTMLFYFFMPITANFKNQIKHGYFKKSNTRVTLV